MLLEELSELADGETGADLVDTFELAVADDHECE